MILVAGITRSGLTLTMQMLQAGGYPVCGEYPAFEPYPFGHIPWTNIGNRAVKVVDIKLQFPPLGSYKVIALRRNLKQQAKSINKFNAALIGLPAVKVGALVASLKRDYIEIDNWLCTKENEWLRLQFENMIYDPIHTAREINSFVGGNLDIDKMAAVVKKRNADCYPGLLEAEMIES